MEENQEQIEASVAPATLTSLIQSLHKAVEEANSVIARYAQKLKDHSQKESVLHEKYVALETKSNSVMDREAECQKVENAVNLHEEATALMNEASLRLDKALEAEKHLRDTMALEIPKLNELRLQQQKEANNILAQRKDIDNEVNRRLNKILSDNKIVRQETSDATAT